MAVEQQRQQAHFLVATYPLQGHVNPALHLARRFAAAATDTRVTFSTTVSAHRRMFPSSTAGPVGEEFSDGQLSFLPFSDGHDDGYPDRGLASFNEYMAKFHAVGSETFSKLVGDLAARGRPVTCIVFTLLLPWAADVARDHGIPSVLYWIQPAAVFAAYYHYFHGYEALISSHRNDPQFAVDLPGLPSLQIKDIPTLLTMSADDPIYSCFLTLRVLFEGLDKEPTARVLVNTFDALEPDGLSAVDKVDPIAVGPVLPSGYACRVNPQGNPAARGHLFELDKKGYMEWLDSKPEKSVVYVSFGSLSTVIKQQLQEMLMGLEESGRPFLWVVRRDNRGEWVEVERGGSGMVVEWCNQVEVLSHPSVGCFVTHCGWNSMAECLACGVPTVGVPRLSDQGMNAKMAAEWWGTGVRAELNEEGVLEGKTLRRSLDVVMGEGERGAEMRRKAEMWRDRAMEAISEGGSSDQNLRTFMKGVQEGW